MRRIAILLVSLATGWWSPSLSGQDLNPYGRIDPVEASRSTVQRAFGPDADAAVLTSFEHAAPPGLDRLLDGLTRHPDKSMRTAAAIMAVRRDRADPARLFRLLGDDDARSAFVIGLGSEDLIDQVLAATLLDEAPETLSPVAVAELAARADRSDRLASILETSSTRPLAAGVAAGVLESERPGSIERWLAGLETKDRRIRETGILATTSLLSRLGAVDGMRALARATADRPADDAVRAECVLGLIRLAPEEGMQAFARLLDDGGESRLLATAMLLLSVDMPLPADVATRLPNGDALQQAVRNLLVAPPAARSAASLEAVRKGHLPTIRWLLSRPEGAVPAEVLDAIVEAATTRRRGAMIEVLLEASGRLARLEPERLRPRLTAATEAKDDATREALLRALVLAASPEAAEVARAWLDSPHRRTRSLALLAVAAGEGLDGPSIRRLGRVAAGGGDLPDDLRPLAAWHHLASEDRLGDALELLPTS